MLETILQIGKILREAGQIGQHRYIKSAPLEDEKKRRFVTYISIPVRDDFSFNLEGKTEISDEYLKRGELYYLHYKTSEADALVKYIFGDICYGVDKKGKESGNYRMGNVDAKGAYALSSFYRAIEDAKALSGTLIEKFRDSFAENREKIEALLKEHSMARQVFLHFDFISFQHKHWYQFEEELTAINQKLLAEFLTNQGDYLVLRKSLYKTIASPDADVQFPQFSSKNLFKARGFKDQSEVLDLLYAINYSGKPVVRESSIKVIVLPQGKNLQAEQINSFFEKRSVGEEDKEEQKLTDANQLTDADVLDSLFDPVIRDIASNITHFDFVFSKAGGVSSPDVDMLEVSGLEKSFLAELSKRVKKIRHPLLDERDKLFSNLKKKLPILDIRKSFLNILGDVTKDKKKYQSHLFKVLPQIYTGTYYRDDILLPVFIEKTEFNIRNDQSNFNLLKFDYYFLTRLQNQNGEKRMEEMTNSNSYKIGLLLGKLAQPLDRKIASFEKNYVGLLSRRISDKDGLIKFANFINEKLAIHDVAYPNLKRAFIDLSALASQMGGKEYNKNYCAFGFFESYFARFEKSEVGNQETDNASSNDITDSI